MSEQLSLGQGRMRPDSLEQQQDLDPESKGPEAQAGLGRGDGMGGRALHRACGLEPKRPREEHSVSPGSQRPLGREELPRLKRRPSQALSLLSRLLATWQSPLGLQLLYTQASLSKDPTSH